MDHKKVKVWKYVRQGVEIWVYFTNIQSFKNIARRCKNSNLDFHLKISSQSALFRWEREL